MAKPVGDRRKMHVLGQDNLRKGQRFFIESLDQKTKCRCTCVDCDNG